MSLAIDGSVSNHTSATTTTLTLTTTQSNDVIIVFAGVNGCTNPPTVSGAGLTWISRYNGFSSGGQGVAFLEYYAIAASPLVAQVITVNGGVNTTFVAGTAFGVSGANTVTPFDGANVNFGNLHVAPFDPLTITTSNANTMVIAGWRFSSTATPTAGAGYVGLPIGVSSFFAAEFQVFNTTETSLSIVVGTGAGDTNGGCADALVAGTFATLGAQACL